MQNLDKRISALESTNNATKYWAWRYDGETIEDVLKRIDAEPQASITIFSWRDQSETTN